VYILTNGYVTLPSAFTNNMMSNRVYIACMNVMIAGGGKIDVDAKGYAARNGPGGR